MKGNRDSFEIEGLFWMYTISMFVCWVPIFGGFAAGFVGGWKAGRVKSALTNSFFTAIIFSMVLYIGGTLVFQGQSLKLTCFSLSYGFILYSYVVFLILGASLGGFLQQIHTS
ncbi:MAG: hypothetical protein GXO69_06650 [Acidobacteria bacterium]|nr:hypothetical protein [Acidobacteriota bacterium]